eukprot:234665_1
MYLSDVVKQEEEVNIIHKIILLIIFLIHICLSICISYILYSNQYWTVFWITIGIWSFIYFAQFIGALIVTVTEGEGAKPLCIFFVMIYELSCGKINVPDYQSFSPIVICSWILTFFVLLLIAFTGPFMSFGIWFAEEEYDYIPITHQLVVYSLNFVFDIVLICMVNKNAYYSDTTLFILLSINIFIIIIFYILFTQFLLKINVKIKTLLNIELTAIWFYIFVLFWIDYNSLITDNNKYLWILTIIGCVYYIFPNIPFYKIYLLHKYQYFKKQSTHYSFCMEYTGTDQLEALYSIIHYHMVHKALKGHKLGTSLCFKSQYEFLKIDNTNQQIKYIKSMYIDSDKPMNSGHFMRKLIYVLFSLISYVVPAVWIVLYIYYSKANFNFEEGVVIFIIAAIHILFIVIFIYQMYDYATFNIQNFKILHMFVLCDNSMGSLDWDEIRELKSQQKTVLKLNHVLEDNFNVDIVCIVLSYLFGNDN